MSSGRTVLVVGNDDFELDSLQVLLSQAGEFEAKKAGGSEALKSVAESQVGVVICDIDSMAVADLNAIRSAAADCGAECLLIAENEIESDDSPELISTSDLAAHATKPLAIREFIGQIEFLLDRSARRSPSDVRFGPFELIQGSKLRRLDDGSEIFLTDKEAKLLRLLSSAEGGFAMSRDLMADVWGYHESANSHTLQTHIYSLRQKLETDPNTPQLLVTEKGGYRLAR